jgi:Mg-chelatase subunit ChlD
VGVFCYYNKYMFSWSLRRQIIYGGGTLLVVTFVFILVFYSFFYQSPTCDDGVRNGNEKGVDCGGSCVRLCAGEALNPIVLWSKVFSVTGDFYSLVAYVENPNLSYKNNKVEYEFSLFDENNLLIENRKGETFVPRNKKFIRFESGVTSPSKKPKYVSFKFASFSSWMKDEEIEPDFYIVHSPLLSTSTVPRIEGTIKNESLNSVNTVELVALVFDSRQNTVAVSRTFVDNLLKNTSQDFVFTWPKPFDLGVRECLSPLDLVVALDKSGSMRSESIDPPEPLNTVKSTAENFILNLNDSDSVSVVSFGTDAFIDGTLSSDKNNALISVRALSIGTTTASRETNIGQGLMNSFEELSSERARSDSKKVVVLLTDGLPTEPRMQGQPDYPKIFSESVSSQMRSAGIDIYAIGLGSEVSEGFLKNITGDSDKYFIAPTKETLSSIYNKITAAICPQKPNAIQILYRIQN